MIKANPPTAKRGRKGLLDWDNIAENLKANKGEWFEIGNDLPISTGSHITSGRLNAFRPAGHFEGTIRGKKDGRAVTVYARYVGTN